MHPIIDPSLISNFAGDWLLLLLPAVVKGSILLAALGLVAVTMRTLSASTRHLVWTLGVLCLVVLPLATLLLPQWQIAVPQLAQMLAAPQAEEASLESPLFEPATTLQRIEPTQDGQLQPAQFFATRNASQSVQTASTHGPVESVRTNESWKAELLGFAQSLSWKVWALLFWETGVLALLLFYAIGRARLFWLERNATTAADPSWQQLTNELCSSIGLSTHVRVLQSDLEVTPMTWGILKPLILIPSDADGWDDDQRRNVLLHELHHVKRRDCLTQSLAQFACTVYWFHPLVWMAANRMQIERERACDDQVLMAGSKASSYASHLLEMARSLKAEESTTFATVAMARRSQLSDRLIAVLDPKLRRVAPGRTATTMFFVAALAVLLPLAALQPVPGKANAAPPETSDWQSRVAPRAFPLRVAPVLATLPAARSSSAPVVWRVEPRFPEAPRADTSVGYSYAVNSGETPRVRVVPDAPAVPRVRPLMRVREASRLRGLASRLQRKMSQGRVQVHHSNDDGSLRVEYEGKLAFTDDETDIAELSDDGYFEVEEKIGRERRRFEVEMNRDGELERHYFEGRHEEPLDDEATAWIAEILPRVARELGVGAEARVERIYSENGIDALVKDFEQIESSYSRRVHHQAFMELEGTTDEEREEILRVIIEGMDSDYELAETLVQSLPTMISEGMFESLIGAVENLDSSYERSRVLQGALAMDSELDSDQLAALLEATRGIDSDYEQSQVLRFVAPERLHHNPSRDAFFGAVRNLDSDYERSQLLQNLLDGAEDDPALAKSILDAVADVDSDYERSQILQRTAATYMDQPELQEAFLDAVDEIDSDYERGQVLAELMQADDLSGEGQIAVIEMIERIDSDYEKSQLLTRFTRRDLANDEVYDALARAIDTIDGDHEYGKAMKALKRARDGR